MTYTIDLPVDGILTEGGYTGLTRELKLAYGSEPQAFTETTSGLILPTGYETDLDTLAEKAKERASTGYLLDLPEQTTEDPKIGTTEGGILTYDGDVEGYLKDLVKESGVSTNLQNYGDINPLLADQWTKEGNGDYVQDRREAAKSRMLSAAMDKLDRKATAATEVNIWASAPTYTGWRGDDLEGTTTETAYGPAAGTTTEGGIYLPKDSYDNVESLLAAELESQGITVNPADYNTLDPMAAAILAAGGHSDIVEQKATAAKMAAYSDGFVKAEQHAKETRVAEASALELDISQSYLLDAQGRMASLTMGFSTDSWEAGVSVKNGTMSITVDGLDDTEAAEVARNVHELYQDAIGVRS